MLGVSQSNILYSSCPLRPTNSCNSRNHNDFNEVTPRPITNKDQTYTNSMDNNQKFSTNIQKPIDNDNMPFYVFQHSQIKHKPILGNCSQILGFSTIFHPQPLLLHPQVTFPLLSPSFLIKNLCVFVGVGRWV